MQPNPNAVVGDGIDNLVLERIPNGELVWLKPAEDEPRFDITDAGRVAIVEHEREASSRAAAIALVFGPAPVISPTGEMHDAPRTRRFPCACSASGSGGACPFVINSARQLQDHYRDVHHWTVSLCPACGKPQSAASCVDREHWGVS